MVPSRKAQKSRSESLLQERFDDRRRSTMGWGESGEYRVALTYDVGRNVRIRGHGFASDVVRLVPGSKEGDDQTRVDRGTRHYKLVLLS